jgi:flagellar biogenesis protein FliO
MPPIRMKRKSMRVAAAAAATLVFAQAGSALAQTIGQGSADDISWWRVVAALVLCMALAVAGAFAIRARTGAAPFMSFAAKQKNRLRLIETLRLNPHVNLFIVDCDGREYLVAATAQGVSPLNALPAKSDVADGRA